MPAVIFDIGNVLIHWDVRRLYRDDPEGPAAVEAFLDEIAFHEWNRALDGGADWDEGVAALSARYPRHAARIAAFRDRWHDTVSGPIEGTVAILDELDAAGVPLYGLTNFALPRWDETVARFPFLGQRFRDVLVSGREGVLKPDPAAFRRLLERNGLDPAGTLFVDDSPANVAGAAAVGLDALLFCDPATLRRDLEHRGLLTPGAGGAPA